MSDDEVLAEEAGPVLRVTVNRPEKHNALSRTVLETIRQVFERSSNNQAIKAAVLTGAGDESFAAGGDLHDLASVRTLDAAREMASQGKAALDAIRRFPVPVVAAVNGNALGGGAELAACCDFRVAGKRARIGFIQGRLNITTAWGGGIDLMRLLGPSRALDLMCRSKILAAEKALALGLVDEIAPDAELMAVTDRFLSPILKQAPQVLRAFKALAREARDGASRQQLRDLETENFAHAWVHQDHWAAADAILEKST